MSAAAVVLVVAGLFVTESGERLSAGGSWPAPRPTALTARGTVHAACAVLGFVILVAAMFVFARAFARRRERGWMAYSLASGLVTTAAFILMTNPRTAHAARAPRRQRRRSGRHPADSRSPDR